MAVDRADEHNTLKIRRIPLTQLIATQQEVASQVGGLVGVSGDKEAPNSPALLNQIQQISQLAARTEIEKRLKAQLFGLIIIEGIKLFEAHKDDPEILGTLPFYGEVHRHENSSAMSPNNLYLHNPRAVESENPFLKRMRKMLLYELDAQSLMSKGIFFKQQAMSPKSKRRAWRLQDLEDFFDRVIQFNTIDQ